MLVYLFGFSGRVGAKKFGAILLAHFVLFCVLAISGNALWRDFGSGFAHILGGILMPAAFLQVGWASLSLLVRGLRTILISQGTLKTRVTAQTAVATAYASEPGTQVLRVVKRRGFDRWKHIFLYLVIFAGSAFFVTIPVMSVAGLFGLLLSVPAVLFLFAKNIIGAPELIIYESAFSYKTFSGTKAYRWADIAGPFDVYGGGRSGFPFVGFLLGSSDRIRRGRWKGGNVYTNKLPDNFGMKYADLANLLNQYWRSSPGIATRFGIDPNTGVERVPSSEACGTAFPLIFIFIAFWAVVFGGFGFLIIHDRQTPWPNGSKLQDYCSHHPEFVNCLT